MTKKKNVIKLCLILGITVLITIIICNIYRNYEGGKSNSSYISKYVSTIQYNELSSAVTELSGDTFLYLSYVGDKNVYDLERQIRRQLKINELEDNFIYVDGTSYINDKKEITGLNKTLNVTTKSSIVLPAIIYFKDNVPEDYIDSSEYLFKVGSFEQLIDKYELGK